MKEKIPHRKHVFRVSHASAASGSYKEVCMQKKLFRFFLDAENAEVNVFYSFK